MLDIFPSTSSDKVSALRFQEQSTLLTRKRKEKIEKRERNYIALVNLVIWVFPSRPYPGKEEAPRDLLNEKGIESQQISEGACRISDILFILYDLLIFSLTI